MVVAAVDFVGAGVPARTGAQVDQANSYGPSILLLEANWWLVQLVAVASLVFVGAS